jgi:thioredoxin reductase (NADPH)
METFDAVVIGAGPAGLTAAVYLARFRRRVLVMDGGPPRASWIPESHNTPGFPEGVSGEGLLRRLRQQAGAFGVEVRAGRVDGLTLSEAVFEVSAPGRTLRAPCVLLAAGVIDRKPLIPGLDEAIRRSQVRMCPICDAFEAIDKRLAVFGSGDLAKREAAFLRTYSAQVTVIGDDAAHISFSPSGIDWTPPDKAPEIFDHLYLALGCEMQAGLAVGCGATCDDVGNLIVDAHQMTSVEGLYAAGDVVRGLNQIAVATGEAAIAATAIHNRLRGGAPGGAGQSQGPDRR